MLFSCLLFAGFSLPVFSQTFGNVEIVRECLSASDRLKEVASHMIYGAGNGQNLEEIFSEINSNNLDAFRVLRVVAGPETLEIIPSERQLAVMALSARDCVRSANCDHEELYMRQFELAQQLEQACELDYRTKD